MPVIDYDRDTDPYCPLENPHSSFRHDAPRQPPRINRIRQLRLTPAGLVVVQAIHHLLYRTYGHEDLRPNHLSCTAMDITHWRLGTTLDGRRRGAASYLRDAGIPRHHERDAVLYH